MYNIYRQIKLPPNSIKRRALIYCISAGCGQGKTYQLNNYMNRFIYECNYLYIVPTQELANQQHQDLLKLGLKSTVIHGKSKHDKKLSVQESIKQYFISHNETEGLILIITWDAYLSLQHSLIPATYKHIGDEIPKGFNTYRIFSEMLRGEFRKQLQLVGERQGDMQAICPKNINTFKSFIARLNRTDFKDVVFDFLRDVINPSYDVYVHIGDWMRLVERKREHKDKQANRIRFVSILRPDAMRKVLLAGNKIDNSITHTLMKNEGYIFTDFPVSLRPKIKNNIHVISAYKGRTTRTFFDTDDNIIKMYADINKRIKEPALFIGNEAEKNIYLNDNFKRISISNQGLNQHQDRSILVFYASLNLYKELYPCLNDVGITRELLTQQYLEIIEQSLYRTSARNPKDDRDVYLYVPSNDIGELIKERVGANSHHCLDLFDKPKVISKVEQKQVSIVAGAIDTAIDMGFIDAKRFSTLGLTSKQVTRYRGLLVAGLLDSGFEVKHVVYGKNKRNKLFYVLDMNKFLRQYPSAST